MFLGVNGLNVLREEAGILLLKQIDAGKRQLENLAHCHFGQLAGANAVAGGKDVDQVPVELGQSPSFDPVSVAWNGLGAVVPVVIVSRVANLTRLRATDKATGVVPSCRFARRAFFVGRHR